MACHIVAASGGPGARRVDPSLTSAQRTSIDNGIWMCGSHGALIDRDEKRFTSELLVQWRGAAERRAAIRQSSGRIDYSEFDLFTHEINVTGATLTPAIVGHAFIDSGIPVFWGKQIAGSVRDFSFEMIQNALTHGAAKLAQIRFSPKSVIISDDGNEFDPRSLPAINGARGGGMSVNALKDFDERLVLSVKYVNGINVYQIQYLRTQSDINFHSPCAVSFHDEISGNGEFSEAAISRIKGCSKIVILLPEFMSFSLAGAFMRRLPASVTGREVVFVGIDISQKVTQLLLHMLPGSRFLEMPAGISEGYFYQDT